LSNCNKKPHHCNNRLRHGNSSLPDTLTDIAQHILLFILFIHTKFLVTCNIAETAESIGSGLLLSAPALN
jgi:hypothetical protein